MPHRLHLEQFGPVHALPVLHYRMEFAWLVREAVHRVKPDCIALELPPTLEAPFRRAVARLPEVSVLRYGTKVKKGHEETVYLLVEPADPLVEGARLGRELGIPVALVDVDTDSYPLHHEALPDPYAIHRLGLTPYYEEYRKGCATLSHGPEDRRREQGMAFRLQELSREHGLILFICGMFHLERVKEEFGRPQAAPLERVRRENVALFNLHPDSCREILGEFPFLSAVYELRRDTLPPEPVDGSATLRKRYSVLELIEGGKREIPEEELLRHAVERSARHTGREGEFPDRQRIIYHLFKEAARHYRQETGEPLHLWQKRAFFRFTRNYALTGGMLLPDLFQLLAAARGCIDDNFAYAFWRLATHYPWQRTDADLPTLAISPEEIWGGARRIRFRPRQQRQKGLSHLGFLKRKKEKRPGEWLEGFDNPAICSYPPEDVVIEDYGRFLKKKGAMQLSEELSRTEPFTASLLDGIDMRETLRNLADGRIYVRENQRATGGVGGVVVIFDEDRDNRRFPYRMTWLGEHDQESDMAFYATSPADNIVGPGICRCEYGGFLLSYPPRRMMDVWHDPDYAFARSKAEVLLLAALDYSPEKHVVYAAPRPPRSMFRQLAARMGKKIVYIPLGSLSPVKLKGLRVLHILHGHDKREIAKNYVW
ncbi:hypothetical protein GeomeDRAFT_2408 [Geobacter metallireducens RCH3]|uniref:Uncharacterized protein n=1 Tax=Geobacter metallireducens (strain ATCC 53774 / DSM 7210 / GS-15) TaxID=269799 RepID=Q39ZQ2_GEOMG|nr:hypothetical protein [Geobacter metallireducens]ABB30272.1 hypothetical protein Gmet_0022 [Geobacter metallireducens GS-15]EHP85588.1 hypothetical protein GeomeDRAFT_2408 [Geobacter metallireducens RCH3]